MAAHMKRFAALGLVAFLAGAVVTSAARAAEPAAARKITRKVAPNYPDAARRMRLAGTVRLAALVAADGRVTGTESLGGHPILLASAHDAVMTWKFQVAERASRETLSFAFSAE
jgi:TonB family protein